MIERVVQRLQACVEVAQRAPDRLPLRLDLAPVGLGATAGAEAQAALAAEGVVRLVGGEAAQELDQAVELHVDAGGQGGELRGKVRCVRECLAAEGRVLDGGEPARDQGREAHDRAARAGPLDAIERLTESVGAEAAAHVLRGRVLQVVGLVDHDRVGRGQGAAARGEVAQEQRVIDDDDVRGLGALARTLQEAGAVAHEGAGGVGEAVLALGAEAVPDRVLPGQQAQAGAVAVLGAAQPDAEAGEQAGVGGAVGVGQALGRDAAAAEVVAPPLERGHAQLGGGLGAERVREQQLQRGHVLVKHLLLQVDRVGADDDTAALAQGVERGGDEVGERFAGAGPGLDDQMVAGGQRLRDGAGHADLVGALFEGAEGLRVVGAGGQRPQRELHLLLRCLERGQGPGHDLGQGGRRTFPRGTGDGSGGGDFLLGARLLLRERLAREGRGGAAAGRRRRGRGSGVGSRGSGAGVRGGE